MDRNEEIDEGFERKEQVHGVNIEISPGWEEGSGYEILFSQGQHAGRDFESETITLNASSELAREVFQYAVSNVPRDHPERLYIVYGKVKRHIEEKRREAEAARAADKARKATEYKASLDTSFEENGTVEGIKFRIYWHNKPGEHGAYIVEFPDMEEGFQITGDRLQDNGDGTYTARLALGHRIEVIQKLSEYIKEHISYLKTKYKDMGQDDVQKDVLSVLQKIIKRYDREYLYSQTPGMQHPDVLAVRHTEVNRLKITVCFYEVPFVDSAGLYIAIGELDPIKIPVQTDEAVKRVFDYAAERAKTSKDEDELCDAVSEMMRRL